MRKNILAIVDAPDPDNMVMVHALRFLHNVNPLVALTGRPVSVNGRCPMWDYDLEASRLAQRMSAARFRHNLEAPLLLFDGGIAPRTLVPHHIHFPDYSGFGDVDPLVALTKHGLLEQSVLIEKMLQADDWIVVVGGPMTALYQLLIRCPELATKIAEIHAMFGTWGTAKLMDLGGAPRGAKQFNVACDPQAAHGVLFGLRCPIYLLPTEVTRVAEIGFLSANTLAQHLSGCQHPVAANILRLYDTWYEHAVKPRQVENSDEQIFVHDLAPALSTVAEIRQNIYTIKPIRIDRVPNLVCEAKEWGVVDMQVIEGEGNCFAATELCLKGRSIYLDVLRKMFE